MEISFFPPYIKLMILDITLGRQFPLKFLGVRRAESLKIASNITSSDYSCFFQFKEPFNSIESGLTYILQKCTLIKFQLKKELKECEQSIFIN